MTTVGTVDLHLGGEESSFSARIREVSNPNTDTYGELKLNTPGDQLLYHYTTADTAFGYILPTGTLRMNSYRSMRDPLEKQGPPQAVALRRRNRAPAGLTLLEAQQLVGEIRDQMRILCLTIDAEGYGADEIRAFGRGYARAQCGSTTPTSIAASASRLAPDA